MASSTASSAPLGAGYRPHLDGLRTVAVYLVVLFHAGVDRFSGGFIGVDVFFVLSGYLVTQLLMRDLSERGSIGLGRFYSRRIRRLLPAASVVLIATMLVFSAVASPAEVVEARDSVRAAALYLANWQLIQQSADYFGGDILSSPVVHFWSLSVEEQFYVTWPLLFGGLHVLARRAGSRRAAVVRSVVLAGFVLSLAAALWVARSNVTRAYYGTDTRAYQLLAGALLALSPGLLARLHTSPSVRRHLSWVSLGAIGVLVVLASSLVEASPVTRGALAAGLTTVLLATLEAGPAGAGARLLSRPALTYLGRISYGTYLWHWLVIVVATRVAEVSPLSTAAITMGVATGLAALSYELVERPVRLSPALDTRRRLVVAGGLCASLLIGIAVSPRLLREPAQRSTIAQGTLSGSTPVPADLDWRGAQRDTSDFPPCGADDPGQCTLVTGAGPHLLVIGDSHAAMLLPAFRALAEARDLTLSAAVAPSCPWQQGLQYRKDGEACQRRHAEWYPTVVSKLDPDLVVLVARTFDEPGARLGLVDDVDGPVAQDPGPYLAAVRMRTVETVEALRADEREILIVEPVPIAPADRDPLACLSTAEYLDECRYLSHVDPTPVERLYRELAQGDDGIWTLDLDRRVCPYLPICDPIVGGLIVKRDLTHLTTSFAESLGEPIGELLDDGGIPLSR